MKLMIVEDKKLIRDGICYLLSEVPEVTEISTAQNGKEAWELMMEQKCFPDILLTDIRMPVIDGLDLCSRLREHSEVTKIIFISGYEDFGYAKKAIELGASGYVTKPIAQEELLTLIHQVIREIDRERSLHRQEEITIFKQNSREDEMIRKMLEQMQRNPGEVSLKKFADELGVSIAAVSQFFKEKTRYNFKDYLLDCKMNKAKSLLEQGERVEEICSLLGYSDYDYFGKSFKKYFGKPPTEFRISIHRTAQEKKSSE